MRRGVRLGDLGEHAGKAERLFRGLDSRLEMRMRIRGVYGGSLRGHPATDPWMSGTSVSSR